MVSCSPGVGSACSPLLAVMSFYEHSRFTFQANSVSPEERRRTKMEVLRLFALCLHFLLMITENVSCGIRRVLHQQLVKKTATSFSGLSSFKVQQDFWPFCFQGCNHTGLVFSASSGVRWTLHQCDPWPVVPTPLWVLFCPPYFTHIHLPSTENDSHSHSTANIFLNEASKVTMGKAGLVDHMHVCLLSPKRHLQIMSPERVIGLL